MAQRFNKVLIANRGEIALRVIRGAKKLGYRTVAVYADADASSLPVREADEAVHIGASPAKDSYLVIEKIIAAAKSSGAQAIHPGYGFLSEREAFAQAVADAGLIFIGPDAHSIEKMGNKSASKIRMIAAGVPCVPGYQGDDQSDETLVAEAKKAEQSKDKEKNASDKKEPEPTSASNNTPDEASKVELKPQDQPTKKKKDKKN